MLLIYLYNVINLLLTPAYILLFLIRILKGKDNYLSFLQRFGITSQKRPLGKLIWIHAASVGESVMAITLIKALSALHPEYNFLVTTGTLSSASILEKSLPEHSIHQFTPIDNFLVVRKFLGYWRPDLGIFIESELWPCLVTQSCSKFNLILLNARLSDRSYTRWQNHKKLFELIINSFKKVIVQSKADLHKYQELGCQDPINLGNLKFANKELEVDQLSLESFKKIFGDKKLFVSASTHREDEEVILKVIANLKQSKIDYFPIIIPRHPERRGELASVCHKLGLKFSLRSDRQFPSSEDDLFIVDSFGELGLFYSLAYIVFVGGSFAQGGHNLVEAAYFDNIIMLGPDMGGYKNIVNEMIERKAVIRIANGDELESKIKFFLEANNTDLANNYRQNSQAYVKDHKEMLANYLQKIDRFLP